jgi:hypothetical protein
VDVASSAAAKELNLSRPASLRRSRALFLIVGRAMEAASPQTLASTVSAVPAARHGQLP